LKVSSFIMVLKTKLKGKNLNQSEVLNIVVDLIKPVSYLSYEEKIKLAMETI